MADPFQPKFVDLVRNFTSTAGTGNLVLGEAAPGFTSFAEALQPGDSFYYSVAALEKTTETEVGRGTLQADGSIARAPISGTLTDFSQGRKSVALVAAAEWFDSIEVVRGAAPSAASRSALAELTQSGTALLTESGREGLFLFDGSDLSEKVATDSARGLFVALSTDPSGASGAWVRKFQGPVDPQWFGVVEGDSAGSNAAANNAAWANMTVALIALARNSTTVTRGLITIQFGAGTYEFSQPIELKDGTITVAGQGAGSPGVTRLKFYDCTGFLLQHIDTSGTATKDAVTHFGALRSVIQDLTIEGTFEVIDTEAEYHGIHARTSFKAINVRVFQFAGDGFHIHADSNTVGGNVNSSPMIGCEAWECRNGFWSSGNNCNVLNYIACKSNLNRQWGFFSSSSLGNTFLGCSSSSNGVASDNDGIGIGASVVSHGGNWYGAIAGQETGASTNSPSGTTADNAWWYYLKPNGPTSGRPAWSTGMLVRAGGAVRSEGPTGYDSWISCYAEQDQGKA